MINKYETLAEKISYVVGKYNVSNEDAKALLGALETLIKSVPYADDDDYQGYLQHNNLVHSDNNRDHYESLKSEWDILQRNMQNLESRVDFTSWIVTPEKERWNNWLNRCMAIETELGY